MSVPTQSAKGEAAISLLLSFYLLGTFGWRYLVTAHEYPMRPALMLSLGLDALAVLALIALRVRRSNRFRPQDLERGKGAILFWLALLAGLGLFGIRLQNDASWWTGHRHYDWRTPKAGERSLP